MADEMAGLVAAVARGEAADGLAARVLAEVAAVRGDGSAQSAADEDDLVAIDEQIRRTLTEYETHRLRENIRERRPLFELRVAFDLTAFDSGFRSLTERLGVVAEVIGTLPGVAADDPMKIAFRILFASDAAEPDLAALAGESGGSLERLSRYPEAPADIGPAPVEPLATWVRIDMRVLDELAGRVDALAHRVAGLGDTCVSMARQLGLRQRDQFFLRQQQRAIERAFAEIEEQLVDARLVPLGPTLVRARRLTERLGGELAREIAFESEGEEVRLDKAIVDRIAEPLAHLLRNAVDHGIEAPEDRVQAGKPAAGRVSVTAAASGNRVVLTVRDDGRGIDVEAIRRAATARGIDPGSAGSDRILDVLFTPGFTTAAEVSAVSGRGVGLDAVAATVAQLGGRIRVSTDAGLGASFTLELPTTLVMLSAFIVEAAGWSYAVDVNQLVELGLVERTAIDAGRRRISWRDAEIPYFELAALARAQPGTWAGGPRVPCLIARAGGQTSAIGVDRLVGEREVIVKSFGRNAPTLRGVTGAVDLEDDRIALCVDLSALIEEDARAAG